MKKLLALLLVLCMLPVVVFAEETTEEVDLSEALPESSEEVAMTEEEIAEAQKDPSNWINFLLICNEGMNNNGGNAGNTISVVAMNPKIGKIRLMFFTWDTFVDYEGYDVPQRIDMPYRNNGPEEVMKVFDDNFNFDINLYMSLNYLNLASLIDAYGGVEVDISRAERNALNGMVASKSRSLRDQVATGLLSQAIVDMLAEEYYLNEFGPNTHLNGLQAVGYGWLQYDSVYNCCIRDAKVVSDLFQSVFETLSDRVAFYTSEDDKPENPSGKRLININDITEDDYNYLRKEVAPIFEMSYNNLSEENIHDLTLALTNVAYAATRQGVDIFDRDHLDTLVLPLEAKQPYDIVAGTKGHIIDKEANIQAMKDFLYKEE